MHIVPEPPDEEVLLGGRPPRWRLNSTPTVRALFGAAALLALAALALGALAVHTQPRHRVLTVVTAPARAATTTDAVGCPADRQCAVYGDASGAVLAAFTRAYPSGRVILAEQTVDVATGRVYRISLTGRADPLTSVVLLSQCVPGGAAVGPQDVRRVTDAHFDLNGDWVVYAQALTAVVPGAAGCSVQLSVERTGQGHIDDGAALGLVGDAAVRLAP